MMVDDWSIMVDDGYIILNDGSNILNGIFHGKHGNLMKLGTLWL